MVAYLVQIVHLHLVLSLVVEVERRQVVDCIRAKGADRSITRLQPIMNSGHYLHKNCRIQLEDSVLMAPEKNFDVAVIRLAQLRIRRNVVHGH